MNLLTKMIVFAGPILTLSLMAIAGYSYSQIGSLSLPISQALGFFTVILPLVTGISTQGTQKLIVRSSKNGQPQLTPSLMALMGFCLIYETIVGTLALTHMVPPSDLSCGLSTRWQKLFAGKNEHAIRAIQDRFNCCGFNTVKDRPWPFGSPSQCAETFGRTRSCIADWRKAEQTYAGLLLLVAVVVFLIKLLSIISLLTRSSWTRPFNRRTTGDVEDPEEDTRATMRRLIEEGTGEGEHDDERAAGSSSLAIEASNGPDRRPRVEPSQLIDTGNEWRDEGQGH